MIFVTVGSVLPFDRLVRAVDAWALAGARSDLFSQIGNSRYQPRQMTWRRLLSASEFRTKAKRAELIVAHAGIGTILTATELKKPLIVMPRRAALGEHTSDHQMATAKHLARMAGIPVACDDAELHACLDAFGAGAAPVKSFENDRNQLLKAVRGFIACC